MSGSHQHAAVAGFSPSAWSTPAYWRSKIILGAPLRGRVLECLSGHPAELLLLPLFHGMSRRSCSSIPSNSGPISSFVPMWTNWPVGSPVVLGLEA